ncbi:MAG: hypothetical protein M1827_000803 [Pycnora praestabilis]|nr:MAG: hypothetical protein M1827_000803 [Pycnora praestabilis]
MSGLVDYGSSDEEDDDIVNKGLEGISAKIGTQFQVESSAAIRAEGTIIPQIASLEHSSRVKGYKSHDNPSQQREAQSAPAHEIFEQTIEVGPMVGPSGLPESAIPKNGAASRSQSPYTSTRSMIRDHTLPPIPNLDIPPSPPGSPSASTDAKFAHFLQLKKQGIHFNEKLARSSALKNPSLLQKLMDFAGIDEKAQYASTLPQGIWDPNAFPAWAYKEELAKSQQEVLKWKEEEKAKVLRDALDFVPATKSGDFSRGGTPGLSAEGRAIKGSAAERVMAGLDRERKRSPLVYEGMKRKDCERRGGRKDTRNDGQRSRDRSRSRSPRRRRESRSR